MTDRKQAIKDLEDVIAIADGLKGLPSQYGGIIISLDKIDSLRFALESIKVDRAYDLAYEKVDFIEIPEGTTNGDIIKAMFPQIQVIENGGGIGIYRKTKSTSIWWFTKEWWNSHYRKEQE